MDEELLQAGTTGIVLTTPMPVEDIALRRQKFDWMRKLCQGGVHFGLPTLHASDGIVLRYDPGLPTLAQVAARLIQAAQENAAGIRPGAATSAGSAEPCEKVVAGRIEQADFLDPRRPALHLMGAAAHAFRVVLCAGRIPHFPVTDCRSDLGDRRITCCMKPRDMQKALGCSGSARPLLREQVEGFPQGEVLAWKSPLALNFVEALAAMLFDRFGLSFDRDRLLAQAAGRSTSRN